MDEVLFPTAAMLAGISLLMMQRLPQDLVEQSVGGQRAGPGSAPAGLGPVRLWPSRCDRPARPQRRLAAPVQVHLGGGRHIPASARLRLRRRDRRRSPHASYRSRLRSAIGAAQGHPGGLPGGLPGRESPAARRGDHERGPLRLPPLPYLLPMLAMWGIALAIVIIQSDLGAALALFPGVPGPALRRNPAYLIRRAGHGSVSRWRIRSVRARAARSGAHRHLAQPVG